MKEAVTLIRFESHRSMLLDPLLNIFLLSCHLRTVFRYPEEPLHNYSWKWNITLIEMWLQFSVQRIEDHQRSSPPHTKVSHRFLKTLFKRLLPLHLHRHLYCVSALLREWLTGSVRIIHVQWNKSLAPWAGSFIDWTQLLLRSGMIPYWSLLCGQIHWHSNDLQLGLQAAVIKVAGNDPVGLSGKPQRSCRRTNCRPGGLQPASRPPRSEAYSNQVSNYLIAACWNRVWNCNGPEETTVPWLSRITLLGTLI